MTTSSRNVRTTRARGWSTLAIVMVLGLGVLAGAQYIYRNRNRSDDPMAQLVGATGGYRFIEPRLTGGFGFEPLPPQTSGTTKPHVARIARIARVAVRIRNEQAGQHSDNVAVDHAIAAAHLLLNRPDVAASRLTALVERHPRSARLYSDLAATHLVLGPEEPFHYVKALDAASRALEIQPDLAEARFNTALALTALGLARLASITWQELAESNADAWGAEALERARRIDHARYPGRTTLIADLATATARRDRYDLESRIKDSVDTAVDFFFARFLLPATSRDIEDSLFFGETFLTVTGESLPADIAQQLRRADAKLPDIVDSHRLFLEARRCVESAQWSTARPVVERAIRALQRRPSPLLEWALFYDAVLDTQAGRFEPSLAKLANVLASPGAARQPLLRARAHYARSVAWSRTGQWPRALQERHAARDLFRQAGDAAWAGFLAEQIAEVYSYLGRPTHGWRERIDSISTAATFAAPLRRVLAFNVVGDDAYRAGLPLAALHYYKTALAEARFADDAVLIADSILGLLPAQASIDHRRALGQLEDAERAIKRIPDEFTSAAYEAALLRTRGTLPLGTPVQQREWVRAAIDEFSARGQWGHVLPLLERQAGLRLSAGDREGAERDFRSIVRLSEAQVQVDDALTTLSLGPFLRANEALLSLGAADDPEPSSLLDNAERLWHTRFSRRVSNKPEGILRAIQGRLAPRHCVLAYQPTRDALLSWSICPGHHVANRTEIPRERLAAAISSVTRHLQGRQHDEGVIGDLATVLLEPHRSLIATATHLYVVGGGPASLVPWGGMTWDGQPFVSGREIAHVPSLTYMLLHEEAGTPDPRRFLGVSAAGPVGDLPPLPGASDEVTRVFRLAASGILLQEEAATPPSVERAIGAASILHFAGHAVQDVDWPRESGLVLHGEDSAPFSVWTIGQIESLDLSHIDLVFLAGCRTGEPTAFGDEVGPSVAEAFLAAGASTVVSALWDVADEDAPTLATSFYEGIFLRGATPAAAVAALQEDLLEQSRAALIVHTASGAMSQ